MSVLQKNLSCRVDYDILTTHCSKLARTRARFVLITTIQEVCCLKTAVGATVQSSKQEW